MLAVEQYEFEFTIDDLHLAAMKRAVVCSGVDFCLEIKQPELGEVYTVGTTKDLK